MDHYHDFDFQFQDQAEDSGDSSLHQSQHYGQAASAPLQDQPRGALYHPTVPPNMSCEVKPRLTKDQHDVLEAHFQSQHKPSTGVKRGFAESLGVSLDKVNNWFQNRRAKSKQDAKKAAGQVTLYQTHSQTFGSDSEPSPFQPSQQYATMMQHMSSNEHLPNGLGISQVPREPEDANTLSFGNHLSANGHLENVAYAQGLSVNMFDSLFDDMNRRTLTQEQFDAMEADNPGMINGAGQFASFEADFSGNHDAMNQIFPEFDLKQQQASFPSYQMVPPPLSSNDSTVPSVVSEHSAFPSSHAMQNHANMSASSSEWADSRSSSLASTQHVAMGAPMLPPQQLPQTTSQWEPGQSVPVNVDAMKDEFDQVAAARASMDQSQAHEQPLAYPHDEAYSRRGSTTSMLAQSMGSVGLHTPQPNQGDGVFKSPAPPATSSIAARRQRPKPANLGIASLRSQSYGGPGQPGSPGHQHNMTQGQPIRRVMSSNVLNGGVAQGRVMKSVPGSAQRSPLNWTFNHDALSSPHLVRAMSQGNLAPPTPMSPSHPSQVQQPTNGQLDQSYLVRQPSISEAEEHGQGGFHYQSAGPIPPNVSPPHTPMWYQQACYSQPQRVGSHVITENTPPQSAPASQSCFPSNIFGPPPQLQHPHMAAIVNAQQQQYLNLAVPEQQYQVHPVTFAQNQHANVVSSGPAPGVQLTFANGVPVMRDGNYQMSFPSSSQMQMVQQQQQTNSPPQMPYSFVNSNGGSPGSFSMSQPPKLATQPANDFVVHEYSPPDSIKRSVTPRKAMDNGPKNYSFANVGPVDYEEKKAKKESSSSPASSNGTLSSS